jgi:hypothetical protein
MDHHLIEEQSIAESYVMGQLSAQDETEFEEHLLECRECRERVAWAEDLRGSLRDMAAADEAQARVQAVQIGLLAWLARHGRAARLGLAAILFLLAATLPGWLLVQQRDLRQQLAEVRAAARKPVPPPLTAPPSDPGLRAERDRLAAERHQLDEELQAERRKRDELAQRLASLTRPQVNAALFSLGLVRGGEGTNQVQIGPQPAWIVLSLELPPTDATAWRATLLDARGHTVWKGDGLHPTAADTLTLGLYSDLLAPGAYRLLLEPLPPHTPPATIAIPFQVVQRP